MREIKFRAWTKDEMLYEGWNKDLFVTKETIFRYDNVMQYTGLKDKNGKEIYEGDLMRVSDESPVHKVEYVVDDACWYLWCESSKCFFLLSGSRNIMEVVGNEYENPELLNSEQNPERSVATEDKSRNKS